MATRNPLIELTDLGQSIWLDSIQRRQLVSGDLARLIEEDGIRGETANPTIFEKAIGGSDDYDDTIRMLGRAGAKPLRIYETLALEDIRTATDIFRPVYDSTGGADGFVSIEVSPYLAHDTAGTIAEVRRFHAEVNRPNVMVKIPGTVEGLPAIEQCLYEGININITLLFSVAAYEKVAHAYIRALERRAAEGKPVDKVASVASFFVSRIDTLADRLLEEKLKNETSEDRKTALRALQGRAAIANAQMAYRSFKRIFADTRFRELASRGARVQRPLWASTSTKDPRYRDVMYVEALIGAGTVNTLPLETIHAFKDHGRVRPALEEEMAGAEKMLRGLEREGIRMEEITERVLAEGVEKFSASLDAIVRGIEAKLARLGLSTTR